MWQENTRILELDTYIYTYAQSSKLHNWILFFVDVNFSTRYAVKSLITVAFLFNKKASLIKNSLKSCKCDL